MRLKLKMILNCVAALVEKVKGNSIYFNNFVALICEVEIGNGI
ncbi:hypothetical protein [Borrelia miyamotoi]|nr:hypothetical protein [Borrelia miyamotoi]